MAITPADIEQQTFSPSKHGYDTEEVDAFLELLSSEVDAMLQKIADLKGRLTSTEQQLSAAKAQIASYEERGSATVAAPVVSQPEAVSASERQISQVLIVAQQSADKLVADARANAEKIRNEADGKAREVIRQALAEKQNELDEIDRLKISREQFRSEYKKLLQHFMDDADAMFPTQASISSQPNGSDAGVSKDATGYGAPSSAAPSAAAATPVSTPAPAPSMPSVPAVSLGDFGDLD